MLEWIILQIRQTHLGNFMHCLQMTAPGQRCEQRLKLMIPDYYNKCHLIFLEVDGSKNSSHCIIFVSPDMLLSMLDSVLPV